jgi:hypothetical protein
MRGREQRWARVEHAVGPCPDMDVLLIRLTNEQGLEIFMFFFFFLFAREVRLGYETLTV